MHVELSPKMEVFSFFWQGAIFIWWQKNIHKLKALIDIFSSIA
jgi:hypothetical protein